MRNFLRTTGQALQVHELCRRYLSSAALIIGLFGAASVCVAGGSEDGVVDRFVASLGSNAGAPATAAELIRTRWSKCDDCDGEEFLTQGLAVLSREFREGLDAYDADDYAGCARRMAALVSSTSPFISTNAAAYEIKSLIALDQMLEAAQRIEQLTAGGGKRLAAHSYFSSEMMFLEGYCLLADLKYDAAEAAFHDFLVSFPDAPARLAISANQILLELAHREPGKLGEVVDLMQFSSLRMKNADGGEVVQSRQQTILDLLDRMIKEEEDKEQSCDSGGGGGSSGGSPPPGAQSPSNPMEESQLPGGDGSAEGALRAARRANPGEAWGAMPPGERDRILQALRDGFPSRYRQLVEQYYEELAKKP